MSITTRRSRRCGAGTSDSPDTPPSSPSQSSRAFRHRRGARRRWSLGCWRRAFRARGSSVRGDRFAVSQARLDRCRGRIGLRRAGRSSGRGARTDACDPRPQGFGDLSCSRRQGRVLFVTRREAYASLTAVGSASSRSTISRAQRVASPTSKIASRSSPSSGRAASRSRSDIRSSHARCAACCTMR